MPALAVAAEEEDFEAFVGLAGGLQVADVAVEAGPEGVLGGWKVCFVGSIYEAEVAFLLSLFLVEIPWLISSKVEY